MAAATTYHVTASPHCARVVPSALPIRFRPVCRRTWSRATARQTGCHTRRRHNQSQREAILLPGASSNSRSAGTKTSLKSHAIDIMHPHTRLPQTLNEAYHNDRPRQDETGALTPRLDPEGSDQPRLPASLPSVLVQTLLTYWRQPTLMFVKPKLAPHGEPPDPCLGT